MNTTSATPRRLVRAIEVCAMLGICRQTLWRMVRRGEFPAPLHLTATTRAWRASDVDAWIDERAAAVA